MLPVLFKIGPYPVHSWGLLLMLGFLLAAGRAAHNARRYQFTREDVWDVALFGLLGGVLGGRIGFVIQNLSFYAHNAGKILALWDGGMTFYGGMAGGILAGVLVCRAKKMNVADMADLAAVSFPLGYMLGRIGCFLNGCCYGGACDLPWAVRFHTEGGLTVPSHPAQLYSAFISLGIYFALLPIERARKFRGQVMFAYLFLYGIYRFLIEFVREGATADVTNFLHLTLGQIVSLALSAFAAFLWVQASRRAVRGDNGGSGIGDGENRSGPIEVPAAA